MRSARFRGEKQDELARPVGKVWRRRPHRGLPFPLPGAGSGGLYYHIAPAAQATVDDHVATDPPIERGGLLLGIVYHFRGIYLVEVQTALPARFTEAGPAHLTFTTAAWLDMLNRRAAHAPSMTVGWYHSHPGLGVFLSGLDLNLHYCYFGDQPWYLALVVDPLAKQQGMFGWQGGQVARLPAYGELRSRTEGQDEISTSAH